MVGNGLYVYEYIIGAINLHWKNIMFYDCLANDRVAYIS